MLMAYQWHSCPSCIADFIQRKGRENVTVDDVVKAIRPEGRATVPDSVKAELLSELKKFIHSI